MSDEPEPTSSNPPATSERTVADSTNASAWRDLMNRMHAARGVEGEPGWGGGVVLLGAGCSVTAGIPAAQGVVDLALRYLARRRLKLPLDQMAKTEGRLLYDQLKNQGLSFTSGYGADLYHELFDGPLSDRKAQQEIIQVAIEQGDNRLNWAHLRLGHLVKERYFHTVLTTNFDQLALEGLIRCGVLPAVADGLEALDRLSDDPRWPQLVHLHGSRHSYRLLNSRAAVDGVAGHSLSRAILPRFLGAARFLLLVGYSASDNGIRALLAEALRAFPELPVYWAIRGAVPPPPVAKLHVDHPGCINLLRGQDADALFDTLAQDARLGRPPWAEDPAAMLESEAVRIVSPANPSLAARILADHKAELQMLAAAQARHRAAATLRAQQERALDGLLIAGDFTGAETLLRKAMPPASINDWIRLAEAAAQAVREKFALAAGESTENAFLEALNNAPTDDIFDGANLYSIGTALAMSGRIASAERAFQCMASAARRQGSLGERDLSTSLGRLGDLAGDRGDREEAERLHTESLSIDRRLAEQLGTPEAQRDLSISLGRLGDLARDRGDLEEAEHLYTESLAIDRRLAEQLGTPEAQRDLSISLGRLGDLARGQSDRGEAERLYTESLAIRRRLAEQLGTPEAQRDLSYALGRLGGLMRDRGDHKEAERLHTESLAIDRRLAEQLGTPGAQRDLSISLGRLGDLTRDRGDREEAERLHAESFAIRHHLAEQLSTPRAQRDLSVSLERLGDLARDRGDREEAERLHMESLVIRRRLAEQLGTPEAQRDLSYILGRLGDLARDRGDREEAERLHTESLIIRRHLAKQLDTPKAWDDVVISAGRCARDAKSAEVAAVLLKEAELALSKATPGISPSRAQTLNAWLNRLKPKQSEK